MAHGWHVVNNYFVFSLICKSDASSCGLTLYKLEKLAASFPLLRVGLFLCVVSSRALCSCHYACDCILPRHSRLCPHIVMPYRLAMQHKPCLARIYPAMAWCIVRQLQLKGLLQKGQGDKSEAEAGSQNVRATCRPLRGMTMSRRGKGLQH